MINIKLIQQSHSPSIRRFIINSIKEIVKHTINPTINPCDLNFSNYTNADFTIVALDDFKWSTRFSGMTELKNVKDAFLMYKKSSGEYAIYNLLHNQESMIWGESGTSHLFLEKIKNLYEKKKKQNENTVPEKHEMISKNPTVIFNKVDRRLLLFK